MLKQYKLQLDPFLSNFRSGYRSDFSFSMPVLQKGCDLPATTETEPSDIGQNYIRVDIA